MSVAATRDSRMETWYRRLLALYPKDHRREHAEEMVGVLLLSADGDAQVRAPKPVAWALRFGQHTAEVLREQLGYTDADIATLRENGVIDRKR